MLKVYRCMVTMLKVFLVYIVSTCNFFSACFIGSHSSTLKHDIIIKHFSPWSGEKLPDHTTPQLSVFSTLFDFMYVCTDRSVPPCLISVLLHLSLPLFPNILSSSTLLMISSWSCFYMLVFLKNCLLVKSLIEALTSIHLPFSLIQPSSIYTSYNSMSEHTLHFDMSHGNFNFCL